MASMKIAYFCQAGVPELRHLPYSGPALHVWHVVDELRARGHHVCLLAMYGREIWKNEANREFQRLPCSLDQGLIRMAERLIRRVQYELQLPYFGLFDALRFIQICKRYLNDYDLFYERMGWMGYAGAWAANILDKPFVLEINGDHLDELEMLGLAPTGLQRVVSIWLMRQAVAKTTHSIAAGEGWATRFMERWEADASKVTVIENGTELVELIRREEINNIAHLDNEAKAVYVGAFEPWHGLQKLIQATATIATHYPSFSLELIGAGTEESELRNLVKQHSLQEQVIFHGHLPAAQVARLTKSANIGFSTYCGRREFSGLKLLDYKAAGLATIASGMDGEPSVISHRKTGLIVEPCSVPALQDAIIELIENPTLRQQLGLQARNDAEQLHSWRHTVDQIESLFVQLTAHSTQ